MTLPETRPTLADMEALDPDVLVRRAAAGCEDAFAELCRRYRPRLLNLLLGRLGGQRPDAEDVAQEALLRAYQNLDRFDGRGRFSTWLYTIAIRIACDHARMKRRRLQPSSIDEAALESAADDAPSIAESREDVDNLWQTAKRVLCGTQFTALWLRYGEDLTPAEVARVMDMTVVGVRVLVHRARSRMIGAIGKQALPPARTAAPCKKEGPDVSLDS